MAIRSRRTRRLNLQARLIAARREERRLRRQLRRLTGRDEIRPQADALSGSEVIE